jgi:hypothetical protein
LIWSSWGIEVNWQERLHTPIRVLFPQTNNQRYLFRTIVSTLITVPKHSNFIREFNATGVFLMSFFSEFRQDIETYILRAPTSTVIEMNKNHDAYLAHLVLNSDGYQNYSQRMIDLWGGPFVEKIRAEKNNDNANWIGVFLGLIAFERTLRIGAYSEGSEGEILLFYNPGNQKLGKNERLHLITMMALLTKEVASEGLIESLENRQSAKMAAENAIQDIQEALSNAIDEAKTAGTKLTDAVNLQTKNLDEKKDYITGIEEGVQNSVSLA